jgi:MFS family permease
MVDEGKPPSAAPLVFFVLLSCLFFSGIIFGYAPLLLLLEKEGVYSELCKDGHVPCEEQEDKFSLCFVLATFVLSFMSLPVGVFLDRFGPQKTLSVATVLTVSGCVGMAFADSKKFDVFLPSFMGLAGGGVMCLLAAFPSSFLLPQYQAGLIAAFSCLFDASSIVFSLFYQLNQHFGWSRRDMFLSYAGIAVVVLMPTVYLWGAQEKVLKRTIDDDSAGGDGTFGVNETKSNLSVPPGNSINNSRDSFSNPTMPVLSLEGGTDQYIKFKDIDTSKITHAAEVYVPVANRGFADQLRSFEFCFIISFASLQMLKANTYLGCVVDLLNFYGDNETGHLYSKIFGFVLPAGIVCVPFIDWSINRLGLAGSLHLTNLVGLLFSGLAVYGVLEYQIATFVSFTVFRAFLYAVMTTYNAQVFGLETLGRITGSVFTSSSLVGLLQYPLIGVSVSYFHGNFSVLLYILCGVSVPTILLIFQLQRHRKRRGYDQGPSSPDGSRRSSTLVSGGSTPLTFSPSRSGRFSGYGGTGRRPDQNSSEKSPNSKSNLLDSVVDEYYYDTINNDQIPQTI